MEQERYSMTALIEAYHDTLEARDLLGKAEHNAAYLDRLWLSLGFVITQVTLAGTEPDRPLMDQAMTELYGQFERLHSESVNPGNIGNEAIELAVRAVIVAALSGWWGYERELKPYEPPA